MHLKIQLSPCVVAITLSWLARSWFNKAVKTMRQQCLYLTIDMKFLLWKAVFCFHQSCETSHDHAKCNYINSTPVVTAVIRRHLTWPWLGILLPTSPLALLEAGCEVFKWWSYDWDTAIIINTCWLQNAHILIRMLQWLLSMRIGCNVTFSEQI